VKLPEKSNELTVWKSEMHSVSPSHDFNTHTHTHTHTHTAGTHSLADVNGKRAIAVRV